MSVRVNVRMFKIMLMPIKLGVRTYSTYANFWTLNNIKKFKKKGSLESLKGKVISNFSFTLSNF